MSPNKPQKFNILKFLMAKLVCFDYRNKIKIFLQLSCENFLPKLKHISILWQILVFEWTFNNL